VVLSVGLIISFSIGLFSVEAQTAVTWNGVVRDAVGRPVAGATLEMREHGSERAAYTATTTANGDFSIVGIQPAKYEAAVTANGKAWSVAGEVDVKAALTVGLQLQADGSAALVPIGSTPQGGGAAQGSGGERLSSTEVSSLPLNERDFSKLLLLAAGTMTDTNGAANFTQQFSVNGQRGSATVFALDGADTTDPELGGATFANFNVDTIQEVQSNSGVMTADIGHGAAGYTNVISKSGGDQIHGSAF